MSHKPPVTDWEHDFDHTDPVSQNTPEVTVNDPSGIVGSLPAESPQEWSGEQTLDVEMVHTMAPGATIAGPALIAEDETSTFVSTSFDAHIDGAGSIVMERKEA